MSFFLVPSQNSSTPLYPQSATSQGACFDSLLFSCFHLRLTFESIKEVGSASVLIHVIRSLNPSTNDPSSCTILLPNSNSTRNPYADFGLLDGIYSSASLNSSKAGCVATLSICSLVTCKPSYVLQMLL